MTSEMERARARPQAERSPAENEIERQTDRFALDAFIEPREWDRLGSLQSANEIRAAAKKLAIDPSIIAGRIRREAGDYRKHRTLIGQGQVKKLFWPERHVN